jgi:hypothetical protein
MKKDKRVKTLLGLFLPEFWPEVRKIIEACKLMSEASKAINIDYLVDIEFVFERGDKMTVYREFIHALNNGMLRHKLGVVIVYLAEHSNLAESEHRHMRINAIRQGFKRYRKNFS